MRLGKTPEEQISQLTSQLEIVTAEIQREIRERESLETELAEKTKILLAFSKYSLDLTFIFDVNSKFIYASPSVCKLTELSIDQIMDARLEAFFHTDDMKLVQSVIRSAVSTPGEVVSVPDFRVRHHDLRWLYFAGTAAYMQEFGAEGGVVFNLHDVTDRKKQENIIHRQANYDELTGLPNRMLFLDRLSQAILRSSREKHHVGILFIDLDGFKQINDTLGHSAGDELLRIIADRFRTCIRQDDTVARLGGDEFTVILPNITKPNDADIVAKKILNEASKAITLRGTQVHVSGSIGIALYPDDAEDEETLIKNADIAMYAAKDDGRRTYKYFRPAMNRATAEKLDLENELRLAVDGNHFEMRFQPIIDLHREIVTGAEALIRWNHPKWGLVSPDKFIPLAEEKGLIVAIGEQVIAMACEQCLRWQAEGFDYLNMAVNVSPRQCHEPGFSDMVSRVLKESNISPETFTLEITEGVFIESAHSNAVNSLQECRIEGSLLSLDDFGTGYSSLSYLKRFPVDVVKIDRAFVSEITTSPEDSALCRAIIDMAHAFNLKVVGEGIETKEQADVLKALRCDRGQGYLMSKPLTGNEFSEFLSSWNGMS